MVRKATKNQTKGIFSAIISLTVTTSKSLRVQHSVSTCNSSPKHCQSSANFNLKVSWTKIVCFAFIILRQHFPLLNFFPHFLLLTLLGVCFLNQCELSSSVQQQGPLHSQDVGKSSPFCFSRNWTLLFPLISLILVYKKIMNNHSPFITFSLTVIWEMKVPVLHQGNLAC